jgi:hypothetical protein
MENQFIDDDDWEITDDIIEMCDKLEHAEKRKLSIMENDTPMLKKTKTDKDIQCQQFGKENEICVVCLENHSTILFKPCRHLVTCSTCAAQMVKCPSCNTKIHSCIPGLSCMYNISSCILESKFIFGRAIFTADQSDIFLKDQKCFLHSITVDNEEDKMHLWFPYFCNRLGNQDFGFPSDVSAVIILEGFHKFGISQQQTFPIGILLFRLDTYARKSVILQSFFTKSDLVNNYCKILWFSKEDIINFGNYCNKHDHLSWSYLIYIARSLLHTTHKTTTCSNQYEIVHDTLAFVSEFQLWVEKSSLFGGSTGIIEVKENSFSRPLTHIESMWLFAHIKCRYSKKFMLSAILFNTLLNNIRISGYTIDAHFIVERITENIASKCAAVAAQDNISHMMIQAYNYLYAQFRNCVRAYTEYILSPINQIQYRYSANSIYISHRIEETIRHCISNAPTNPFNYNHVLEWCQHMGEYINETYSPQSIYGNVIDNMTCMKITSSPFILYDMLDSSVEKLTQQVYKIKTKRGCQTNLVPPAYQPSLFHIASGNLSDITQLPISKTVSGRTRNMFHDSFTHLKTTQHKLLQAAISRTPLWSTHNSSGKPLFHHLVPSLHAGITISHVLHKALYPKNNCNTYTHEIVSSRMHVSTLIFDIDIKPSPTVTAIHRHIFINDLIELTEMVLTKCKLQGKCVYYVFQSYRGQGDIIQYSDDNIKYGFHYHVALPKDTVMSVKACKQFTDILNDIRYMYPLTVGMPVTNTTGEIFDSAIYSETSFHSIRGPFQMKKDGTAKLECVFRSDGGNLKDIPLYHKLVHAPHIDVATGKHVISGTVIDKFSGINLIRNEVFLRNLGENSVNSYAKKACHTTINDIMKEINKRCILFTDSCVPKDIDRLETITNELWNSSKKDVIERMKIPKQDEYIYMPHEIDMMNKLFFKHNLKNNSLSMALRYDGCFNVPSFKLPFCPMRAHHNPVTNTIGWVGYEKNMIHLGLFVYCFKESCKNKHFMQDGHMVFSFPFYSDCIRKQVNNYINYVRNSDPALIRICENKEDSEISELYINTNNDNFNKYISGLSSIHQLYAFVNDSCGYFLLCITRAMEYVAIIISHDKMNGHIFNSNVNSLLKGHNMNNTEVYIQSKDPNALINYLHKKQKVSDKLFHNILNVLELER